MKEGMGISFEGEGGVGWLFYAGANTSVNIKDVAFIKCMERNVSDRVG